MRKAMYRLVFLNGKDKGRRVVIHEPIAFIGRRPESDVFVDDEKALDRHASLEAREEGVYVRADELAPLSVNDAVLRSTRLDHDDIICVGETQIQYQHMAETPFYERRRVSLLHLFSLVTVLVVLIAQAAVVARLMMGLWELDASEQAETAPATPPRPAPSPDAVQEELVAARDRLDRLAVQSAEQSTEEIWAGNEASRLAKEREELESSIEQLENQVAQWEKEGQATPSPEAPHPPVMAPTARSRAEALLRESRALVAAGQAEEALDRLAEAKSVAPSFLAVRVMRARLLEQRGEYPAALEEWDDALRLASDQSVIEELTAARSNAARLDALGRSDAARESARSLLDRGVLPQRLRIGALRRNRLPLREGFDEIRMVRFEVSLDPEQPPIRAEGVHFDVRFIDRVVEGQEVFVSRVPVSAENLTVQPPWPLEEEREFSVLYMVPEGFRERDAAERGVRLQFYGFLVRAYYDGILQDVKAFPGSLLVRPDAAHVRP